MPILASATLGNLVSEDSRRSRVFEELGLDYCCNGGDTLAAATVAAGLNLDEVISALDLPDIPEPSARTAGDNTSLAHDIVDTHHSYMWDEMPRLAALVEKVYRVHGEHHSELQHVHATFLRAIAELEPHMTTEERAVFPTIAKLEKGQRPTAVEALPQTLDQLIAEHQVVGDLFRDLKRLTHGYAPPADACNSYRMMLEGLHDMERDLHQHIHKENNILFPAVRELI